MPLPPCSFIELHYLSQYRELCWVEKYWVDFCELISLISICRICVNLWYFQLHKIGENLGKIWKSQGKLRKCMLASLLQLVESVTLGHVMMETVLHGVDIEAKKKHVRHKIMKLFGQMQLIKIVIQFTWKSTNWWFTFFLQLLHLMGDLRLAPPVDDKVRKVCSTHTTLTFTLT